MVKKKGWLTFTDDEKIRVSTAGENFVKFELGKEKVKPK
jgi:hypothetical protein